MIRILKKNEMKGEDEGKEKRSKYEMKYPRISILSINQCETEKERERYRTEESDVYY